MGAEHETLVFNSDQIARALHRRPSLSLVNVANLNYGPAPEGTKPDLGRATGILKDLSGEEFRYLEGHFGILPGVLGVKALVDLSLLYAQHHPEIGDRVAVLSGIPKARFTERVIPGQIVDASISVTGFEGSTMRTVGQLVNDGGKGAVAANLNFDLIDKVVWEAQQADLTAKLKEQYAPLPKGPTDLNKRLVEHIIPHRDPFLFVERVEGYRRGDYIWGEPVDYQDRMYGWMDSREQGDPDVPELIVWETLAQLGAVMALDSDQARGKEVLLTGISGMTISRPARFGEALRIGVLGKPWNFRRGAAFGSGIGKVITNAAEPIMEGELSFAIPDYGDPS